MPWQPSVDVELTVCERYLCVATPVASPQSCRRRISVIASLPDRLLIRTVHDQERESAIEHHSDQGMNRRSLLKLTAATGLGTGVAAIAATVRPEGGGGNYGPNSGGYDQLGFGTLAYSR
jgi:hypothetical protein